MRPVEIAYSKYLHWRRLLIFFGLLLLVVAAFTWARACDPLKRVWFSIPVTRDGKLSAFAMLPKGDHRIPVVIYFHPDRHNLRDCGPVLRKFAELNIAAVAIENGPDDEASLRTTFLAINNYLQRQPWVLTNAIGWVGYDVAVSRILNFLGENPAVHPNLVVGIPASDPKKVCKLLAEKEKNAILPGCRALFVIPEKEHGNAKAEIKRVEDLFVERGTKAEFKTFGRNTDELDDNRSLLFRMVAEYCSFHLIGSNNLNGTLAGRRGQSPIQPAALCLVGFTCIVAGAGKTKRRHAQEESGMRLLKTKPQLLHWIAAGAALVALVETFVHLLLPLLPATTTNVRFASRFIISEECLPYFERLAKEDFSQGQKLKTLLTHAELAHYNSFRLVNWKVDPQIFEGYVLSPRIDGDEKEIGWRRPLWETLYLRIRKENLPSDAAEIVVRYLRECITVLPGNAEVHGVESIWQQKVTDIRGFHRIYVAAMRSVGIPARMASSGVAELWEGNEWKEAPVPVSKGLLDSTI